MLSSSRCGSNRLMGINTSVMDVVPATRLQYHCSTIVNLVSSFHLGHVISSVTGHVGKTKVNLKETSKFVTG